MKREKLIKNILKYRVDSFHLVSTTHFLPVLKTSVTEGKANPSKDIISLDQPPVSCHQMHKKKIT